jgi:DNA-binding PadR family transcriptional regulator
MYGAEMVEEIRRLSGDVVKMPLPTLYSALHKMDTKKFIRSYWREAEIGGRCRVYNITGSGKDFFIKNKFEINYELLKREAKQQEQESPKHEHKIYATLEEAFSLPLSKGKDAVVTPPQITEQLTESDPTVRQSRPPEKPTDAVKQPLPKQFPVSPYVSPKEPILSTSKQKQMSIDLTGIGGDINLRPLVRLNAVHTDSGFVLFNRLRLFAGIIAVALFAILYMILYFTVPVAATDPKNTIYTIAFVALGVYLAIDFLVWIIFPQTKRRPNYRKLIFSRSIVSFILLLTIFAVYLMNVPQLVNIEPLIFGLIPGVFAFLPFVESLLTAISKKGRWFVC